MLQIREPVRQIQDPTLEELYLAQQQQQQAGGGYGGSSAALLNHLQRDHSMLSQMGQQQHLAALLGLGGGGVPGGGGGSSQMQQESMRQALAAQMRQQQQQQFSQADLLALSRSGALSGLLGGNGGGLGGSFIGGNGGGYGGYGGGGNLASELEGLQRLEEFQRRQRLLQAAAAGEQVGHDTSARPSLERTLAGLGGSGRDAAGDVGSPSHRPKPLDHLRSHGSGLPSSMMEHGGLAGGAPSKEDLEKTPGSVIVPCRARGMPMDHNFKVLFCYAPSFSMFPNCR